MFKYEMHLHSSGSSKCAKASVCEELEKAKDFGLSGIILANHFYHGYTRIDRNLPWKDFVYAYAEDYYKAKEYGKKLDLDVLFAVEELYHRTDRNDDMGKEALIYGLDPEIIADAEGIQDAEISALSGFVKANGGIIACAHPYRTRPTIPSHIEPPIQYFNAVEVYNRFNSDAENARAEALAKEHSLIRVAGGDAHITENMGMAGIAANTRIKTNADLVKILKSGDYKLIIKGEIED